MLMIKPVIGPFRTRLSLSSETRTRYQPSQTTFEPTECEHACYNWRSGTLTLNLDQRGNAAAAAHFFVLLPPLQQAVSRKHRGWKPEILPPHPWVQQIAQAITDEVERHHQTGNRDTGEQPHPPLPEEVDTNRNHAAPFGRCRVGP